MKYVEYLKVRVFDVDSAPEYTDISAVGIGHIRKDLVLIPRKGGKPIEIQDYVGLNIERISAPACQDCGDPTTFQGGAWTCEEHGPIVEE